MGKIENDKMRKLKNEHFIKAFEYVALCLNMTQGALAEAIGSKSSYISNYRNGIRPVPEGVIENLINISAKKPEIHIFSEYLYGNSDIMLLANVTDEEMAEAKLRHENPDFDIIQAQRQNHEKELDRQLKQYIDPSSQFNATISAYIEAIESLKRELRTKDELLAEKDSRLAEKDERIAELKAHNIDLRRQLDQYQNADIDRYPFPVGAAEGNKRQSKRK